MKTALALTAEQEQFWPAIAAELRTIGKLMANRTARARPPYQSTKTPSSGSIGRRHR